MAQLAPQYQNAADGLLTSEDVRTRLQVSRTSLFRLLKEGRLPRPVRIMRENRWRKSDIDKWMAELPAD